MSSNSTSGLRTTQGERRFGIGLRLCWLSCLALPLGLLAIGGGPCAGPRNTLGSVILLTVGLAGIAGGVFGIVEMFRGFRSVRNVRRAFGLVSIVPASVALLGGCAYLFVGYQSLLVYIHD